MDEARSALPRAREWLDQMVRRSPARLAVVGYASVCLFFTGLLAMPWATASGRPTRLLNALFTAFSAVCVTGLTVVDTGTYWSHWGQLVIMLAIKVGGLGIMMLAAILSLAVSRRIGLNQRMLTVAETHTEHLGGVRSLVWVVIVTSTTLELVVALALFPRFAAYYGNLGRAAWHSIFYGISAFNNAGFVPTAEGLTPYLGDWLIAVPLALGAFVGALGFPVILNILATRRADRRIWQHWSLHTKLTLVTSGILVLGAFVALLLLEFTNPATLGPLPPGQKVLAAGFAAVAPRSSGFAALDVSAMRQSTWTLLDSLMFIGGGSASTGGGIKVTTLAVMLLAIRAEARGDHDIEAFGRRIPQSTARVAIAVTFVGATVVLIGVFALLTISGSTLDVVLFETLSAFATVGLTTGLTHQLPDIGKLVIIALMFVGRTGTITLAAALAMRDARRIIRFPQERPIIG